MFIAFVLEGAAILLLSAHGQNPVLFVVLSAFVFFAWGEIYSLFPATNADTYGEKYATTNAGLLYTAKGTAALLVPLSSILSEGGEMARCLLSCRSHGDPCRSPGGGRAQADAPARDRALGDNFGRARRHNVR